MACYNLLASE